MSGAGEVAGRKGASEAPRQAVQEAGGVAVPVVPAVLVVPAVPAVLVLPAVLVVPPVSLPRESAGSSGPGEAFGEGN